ncbi:desmoglein-2.1-like [Eucyclogobius newberryi]|uniref:desmoglein-2.1-like n=1 Tax=Eucyclogobius newberryi TaxID=166745 RepID=UPI003B5BDD89
MKREWIMALLHLTVLVLCFVSCSGAPRRRKREWLVPTKLLKENYDYKNSDSIARIRSDKDEIEPLYYSLHGPGADKKPYNLFFVEEATGLVYIRGVLDREMREIYVPLQFSPKHAPKVQVSSKGPDQA